MNNLGQLLEQGKALGEQIKELTEQIKELTEQKEAINNELLDMMNAQGVRTTGNDNFTAFKQKKTIPVIDDWDVYHEYIYQNKAGYLLQRRPSAKPLEELARLEGKIPGVSFIEIETVTIKKR